MPLPPPAFSQSENLRKFIQPLRRPGAAASRSPSPTRSTRGWWQPGVTHYTIDIGQFTDQLHPDLPNPTRLWGFGQGGNFRHLGGIIAAKRGPPVQITFRNNLPATPHPARRPLDHGHREPGQPGGRPPARRPRPLDERRRPVRLVGSERPQGPELPQQPGPAAGPERARQRGRVLLPEQPERPPGVVPRPRDRHHAAECLRRASPPPTSIYDDYELSLVAGSNLPGPLDPRTVYLVFQDKIFVSEDIDRPTRPGRCS